ncbi:MAG: XdhC family protein [Candidatus Bruticola sp.]
MSSILYQRWRSYLHSQESFSLVTVVRTYGSTPRGAGAKMLVDSSGKVVGTIGGGCPEAEAWQEAKNAARKGGNALLNVNLAYTGDVQKDGGEAMICGGRLLVLVETFKDQPAKVEIAENLLTYLLDAGEAVVSIVCLGSHNRTAVSAVPVTSKEEPQLGWRWLYRPGHGIQAERSDAGDESFVALLRNLAEEVLDSGASLCRLLPYKDGQVEVFAELIAPSKRLYIAGAGHVSRPVAAIGKMCGFAVTVNDDRPLYADPSLFAEGIEVISKPFSEFFADLEPCLDDNCAVVLVTRGHKHDEECLRCLIGKDLGYLGMIGSKRRTRIIMEHLLADGVSSEWLSRVHAPIGLDLGGETPEEIAVAIMAEIVSTFNHGRGQEISLNHDSSAKLAHKS